jgi:hypothetical protein
LTSTITPTPSITATITPTNTITPTPSVTGLIPVTLQYQYVASAVSFSSKTASFMNFTLNGVTYSRPSITFGNSANSTITVGTVLINPSNYVFSNVTRRICKVTAGITQRLQSGRVRIYNGATLLYDSGTITSGTPTLPTCPSTYNNALTNSSSVAINQGDTIIVQWTDSFS